MVRIELLCLGIGKAGTQGHTGFYPVSGRLLNAGVL